MNESQTIQLTDLNGEVLTLTRDTLFMATTSTEYHYKRTLLDPERLGYAIESSRLAKELEEEKAKLEQAKADSKAAQKVIENRMAYLSEIIRTGVKPEKAMANVLVDRRNRRVLFVKGSLFLGDKRLAPSEEIPLCEDVPVRAERFYDDKYDENLNPDGPISGHPGKGKEKKDEY